MVQSPLLLCHFVLNHFGLSKCALLLLLGLQDSLFGWRAALCYAMWLEAEAHFTLAKPQIVCGRLDVL